MKGVIYARYSTDSQREESIDGQIRECKEYAEKNGITLLGSYIDRAMSAKTDNRPEFQRMMKDSAKELFDVIIVWKLDRFSRNRYDSAHNKALLRKNGVKVVSARENISEGSEGIILEAMLEGYAEYFSAELSEKVIRGMNENALKCKYNGGGFPIGFTVNIEQYFELDPLTAPLVLESFKRYSKGTIVKEIVLYLNSKGVRSAQNKPVTINSVTYMLKNRKYIGEYRYRDVVIPEGIPAIVPEKLFNQVQVLMAKNKKAPARRKAEDFYLLTTKLFCGYCGAYMVGESGTSKTGKVHRYYKCVTVKKKKACKKKSVQKTFIENLVIDETMNMLMNDTVIEQIISMLMALQKQENTSIPLLKKQLSETNKGIENMLNAIQQGVLNASTKGRLDKLEETQSQLEVYLLQEELVQPLLTREELEFGVLKFRDTDVTSREQRQRLVDSFINSIYLYDDKILLTFNYKDGAKTITLDEVNSSDLEMGGVPQCLPKEVDCESNRLLLLYVIK